MIHTSKHQAKPFEGKVKVDRYTSIKKLMRAFRRGKLPSEMEFNIMMAQESAERRKA